jgi:hypothetical protein
MPAKLAIFALPTLAAFLVCGCATEQLASTTVDVSASATDVYYKMVLDNLARACTEPGGLPWAIKLTAGGIAVNDTDTLTAGFSEKSQLITPNAGASGNRAWQRSWTVSPVTHIGTLRKLQRYYGEVVCLSRKPGAKPDGADAEDLKGICFTSFHFCSGSAPFGTISAQHGNWSAYVDAGDLSSLTDLTLVVIKTMNAMNSSSKNPTAPPFPSQLLSVPENSFSPMFRTP